MLKIFGKVSDVSLNSTKIDTNCMSTCFNKSDCFLAYFNLQNHCQLFNFNTTQTLEVLKTTKADGFYVAFKVCPFVHLCVYTSVFPDVHYFRPPSLITPVLLTTQWSLSWISVRIPSPGNGREIRSHSKNVVVTGKCSVEQTPILLYAWNRFFYQNGEI